MGLFYGTCRVTSNLSYFYVTFFMGLRLCHPHCISLYVQMCGVAELGQRTGLSIGIFSQQIPTGAEHMPLRQVDTLG